MSCGCNDSGDSGVVRIVGEPGADGDKGWSPLFAVESDGDRRVLRVSNWTNGEGTKPSTTNQYLGPTGIVETAALAVDIRGAIGLTGDAGTNGTNGWSPVHAVVADGATREVLQIVDWTGGTGTKPSTTNQFLGALGIVSTAAAAVNIKGATGATGDAGTDITDGRSKITLNDTTLGYLYDKIAEGPGIHKTELNNGANETLQIGLPSFTGHGGKIVRVNATATDVEYVAFDRQITIATPVAVQPSTVPETAIASLTTAVGVNRDYMIHITAEIGRITTDPAIYFRIYVGGVLAASQFGNTNSGSNGRLDAVSIHHLAKNVAPGTVIEFRMYTGDGNQVYLNKYNLIIDGTPA